MKIPALLCNPFTMFDGSDSSEQDGYLAGFQWSQGCGTWVSLSNTAIASTGNMEAIRQEVLQ